MKINFINIKPFFLKLKIKKAYGHVLEMLNIDEKKISVNLGYVSESAIQKLNEQHRDKNSVTDVLSFPLIDFEIGKWITEEIYAKEKHPQTGLVEIGDIVICETVAKIQAEKYGHSYNREVCFLAVHGFLHVLGFDHQTKEDEELMSNLTEKVLQKVGVYRWMNLKEA